MCLFVGNRARAVRNGIVLNEMVPVGQQNLETTRGKADTWMSFYVGKPPFCEYGSVHLLIESTFDQT